MAHQIYDDIFGNTPVAFRNQGAWHGLGTIINGDEQSETWIERAHLDWRVKKVPLYTLGGAEAPDMFANVRYDYPENDPRGILGYVSDRYQIVQNADGFRFLDSLVANGEMYYEAAGALDGGK